ncbi:hypothetical protein BC628DRAFT_1356623 [Trametes gibbosa]|nr:hypothetical protein BC628DRAFT_1356623 [Trametes gibbosa]
MARVRSGLILAIGGLGIGVYPTYVLLAVPGGGDPGVEGCLTPFWYIPGGGDPCGTYGLNVVGGICGGGDGLDSHPPDTFWRACGGVVGPGGGWKGFSGFAPGHCRCG